MAPDESLPVYVQAHEIARVTGWSSWRTINLLKKAGIAEKVGAYWCTTRHKLREAFPDAYDALLDRIVARREAS